MVKKLKRVLQWRRVEQHFNYVCYCCKKETSTGWYIRAEFPQIEYVFCNDCKENRLI